jgi:hypothetical protein
VRARGIPSATLPIAFRFGLALEAPPRKDSRSRRAETGPQHSPQRLIARLPSFLDKPYTLKGYRILGSAKWSHIASSLQCAANCSVCAPPQIDRNLDAAAV